MDTRFHQKLLQCTATERRQLADFLGFLSAKKSAYFERGKLLRGIPLNEFENVGITLNKIEGTGMILRRLYGNRDTALGVLKVHYSIPKITEDEKGEIVVGSISNIPTDELLKEIADFGEFSSFANKPVICVNVKDFRLCLFGDTKRCYSIKSRGKYAKEEMPQRFKIILAFPKNGDGFSAERLMNKLKKKDASSVRKEIREINKNFAIKVSKKGKLIVDSGLGGKKIYSLNIKTYDFQFE